MLLMVFYLVCLWLSYGNVVGKLCGGCCGAFDRMWHPKGQEDRTKGVGPVLGTTGDGQEFNRG